MINVPEPEVGIFFLVGDRLLIDSVPLSNAEEYGHHRIYGAHVDYWDALVQAGQVTGEYDEHPRGRVSYSTLAERISLLADRCILEQPKVVLEIIRRLHLPPDTIRDTDTDSHYVCPGCTKRPK